MKVLFITDPNIVGGATKSLVELTDLLHDLYGVDITVCTGGYTKINVRLADMGINSISDGHLTAMNIRRERQNSYNIIEQIKILRGMLHEVIRYRKINEQAIEKIERWVELQNFDLIHTNSSRNDIGCILSRKYNIPHIMHIREFGIEDFDCWYLKRNYVRYLNDNVDQFVAVSDAVKSVWSKRGICLDKIKTIYNGVDGTRISRSRIIDNSNEKSFKMVIAGGIIPAKGQYQIIEAMSVLDDKIKANVFLDIWGWGEEDYIENLKKRVKELELNQNVIFCGIADDMGSILHNYHVGINCSRAEGFGRVTAEYMQAGLGVIASNCGANSELIDDQSCGQLYKWNDIADLSAKIEKFYCDRDFLCKCAENARVKAKKEFTKEKNAREIYSLYIKVLEER